MAQKAKEKVLSLALAELNKSQLYSEDTEMNPSQSEDTSTPGPSSLWDTILADSDESETSTGLYPNLNELNKYMKLKRIKISEYPLAFWKTNKQELTPHISITGKDLFMPTTKLQYQ